jgi:hypothetical protein
MKEQFLTYKGFHKSELHFLNEQGELICFNKSRRELMDDFELQKNQNIDRVFKARYFVHYAGDTPTYILSDLTLP